MKKISIGSWAYSIGPYEENPVPWDEVVETLAKMGFDGVELGGFSVHPNPDNHPTNDDRDRCKQQLADAGLAFSGFVPNLWEQELVNAEDNTAYVNEFRRCLDFAVDLGITAMRVDGRMPVRAP